MAESSAPIITPEQIAHAYGIPVEMLGLLPPDAGVSIQKGVMAGTLTGESYVYAYTDDGVLAPGECPTNTAPYVPGQLGFNSMLVAQQPTGWESKTSAEILADIQKTIDLYKGKSMSHKNFPAKEPNPDSPTAGIPAHAVFTSPLIHSKETAEEIAKKMVNQAPTYGLNFPMSNPVPFGELVAEAALATEYQVLGKYLGVDLSKDSGNVVTAWKDDIDGMIHLRVDDANGQEITQGAMTFAEAQKLIEKADKAWQKDQPLTPSPFGPISVGTAWGEPWTVKKGGVQYGHVPLSNHASGTAIDINGPIKDEMHFEVGSLAVGEPVDLGHTEAINEALDQYEKVVKLQTKLAAKKDVSTGPDQWFGEDGQPLPDESDLLAGEEPPELHPDAHFWCIWHDCHGADPVHLTGKVFECGSSAFTRESTPLEDKQVLAKIRMMHEAGLL